MSEKSRLISLVLLVVLCHGGSTPACSSDDFVVAIDVRHSLRSPSAISARGVPEFQFNRDLAAALATGGFRKRFVINADGVAHSLQGRTQEAARCGADLLLSIHHESVQPRYLSNWTLDGVTRPYSDRFRGFSLFVSTKNPQPERSRRFAELLGRSLTAHGLTPTLLNRSRAITGPCSMPGSASIASTTWWCLRGGGHASGAVGGWRDPEPRRGVIARPGCLTTTDRGGDPRRGARLLQRIAARVILEIAVSLQRSAFSSQLRVSIVFRRPAGHARGARTARKMLMHIWMTAGR